MLLPACDAQRPLGWPSEHPPHPPPSHASHHFHLAVWESKSGNTAAAKSCAVTSSASLASFADTRAVRGRAFWRSQVRPSLRTRTSLTVLLSSLGFLGLPGHGTRALGVGEHMAAPQSGPGSGESSVRAVRGERSVRSFIVRLHAAGWQVCVASLSELLVDHSYTLLRSKAKISSTKPPTRSDHGGASTCCQPAEATLTAILDHRRHRRTGRAHCDHRPDCSDLVWTAEFQRLGLFNNSAALHLPYAKFMGAFVQRVRVPKRLTPEISKRANIS
jgi:hypothetical protein